MNNDTNTPDLAAMHPLDRRMLFSAAKTETTIMPDGPIRRPAPRARRNSVRHRSIR